MKCFNHELETTAEKCRLSFDEKKLKAKINQLKGLDLKFIEFFQLVRDYFKWFLLLNITADLIVLTIDIYWIYGGFIYGDNPYFLRKLINQTNESELIIFCCSESCSLPCGKVLAMILVFNSCSNIQAEKEKTPGLICLLASPSTELGDSKRRYLLQKIHTARLQFDGNGFFIINYGTLVSVSVSKTLRVSCLNFYFRLQKRSQFIWFTSFNSWATTTFSL